MAALISAYSGYILLSFLPPVVWLIFYLHEDRHPEPKHLILFTFAAGVLSALAAVAAELADFGKPPVFAGFFHHFSPGVLATPIVVFTGVALIEEYLKYAAVKFTVFSRPEFDEPIDAMIYMVTAALGFAAIENVLFLIPAFEQSFLSGFELTANRFIGANLLHALSSAIVGYAIARHFFSPWRTHAVAVGVITATVLHVAFNSLIITRDTVPSSLLLVVLLLIVMAVVVLVEFERLKRRASLTRNQPVHIQG